MRKMLQFMFDLKRTDGADILDKLPAKFKVSRMEAAR
jgi:hypothetical protein